MKQFIASAKRWLTERCRGLLQTTSRIVSHVFGRVSWSAPIWLQRLTAKWRTFHAARPNVSIGTILGLLAMAGASAWGIHYYKHRPKPHRVTLQIADIPVTRLEKELKFPR